MEGFQINYTDLSDLFWEYKRKIDNLIENIDNCIEKINMFTENAVFTGKTGDAVKSYLGEAHITILSGIKVTAQTLLDNMAAYKDGYRAIDSSTNFKLDEEAIQEFRKKLASNYEDTDEYTGKIRSALSEVSDISDVGMPDSNGVFDIHEQMDSDLIKLVSNVNSYERENVVRLENSVELLLENLQSCLSKIGLSQGAIEIYETGSFITGKDAGTLNTGIKIFGDLHEKNKEAYDEIYETEQKIKDEAEKRKTQGIWRTVGGAVLIATGAACIVLTGGAAIPIVADVAVAVGSGTAVFGAADAIEGTQDIYYGSTGDIDSTAVNGIKDDLFQGNEDAYYLTESAFAFAASAMIPIGQASAAGNLTFRSGATIIAKEGISTAAGAGAQKVTTDLTGNQTAGMLAGMAASAATAKGLNGIEAGAKKLEKPKLVDVGAGIENRGLTNSALNKFEEIRENWIDDSKAAQFRDTLNQYAQQSVDIGACATKDKFYQMYANRMYHYTDEYIEQLKSPYLDSGASSVVNRRDLENAFTRFETIGRGEYGNFTTSMMEDKRLLYNESGELVGKSMIETIKGVDPGKYDSGAFQYCYDSEFVKSADKLGLVNVVNGNTPGASSLNIPGGKTWAGYEINYSETEMLMPSIDVSVYSSSDVMDAIEKYGYFEIKNPVVICQDGTQQKINGTFRIEQIGE